MFAALPPAACAADITAEQTALIHDLMAPVIDGTAKLDGMDKGMVDSALELLKKEQLAGQSTRPNYFETGTLERYGKALFLGARTPEFSNEIAHIRDLIARGNRADLESALTRLWDKTGRTKPDAKALEPVIASLYGAKGEEPEETVRHIIEKSDRTIEIVHARAGGRMDVAVTRHNPDGTDKDRTVFQGVTETSPAGGKDLQRRTKLERVCTSTAETDKDTIKELEGEWTSGDGDTWIISHEGGDKIRLIENRSGMSTLHYTGTYSLGKIAAAHPITAISDMEDTLPTAVRHQLTQAKINFRITLEFCVGDENKLDGTWSSQHVTYDSMSLEVSRIHDPYDLSLSLSRGEKENSAPGAAEDEAL